MIIFFGRTSKSGIPQPFRATVWYSRIHLDFSHVPVFVTNSLRYIVPRLFSSVVTVF